MEDVSIIGIDLAKRSFQLHGARADGTVAFRRKLPPLGSGDCPLGSCGPAHPAHLREAIREATEK